MIIKFRHSDQLCSAYVAYEPSQIKNTIVVYMLDFNFQLGYELVFKQQNKNWTTNASIKTKFPVTYQNLCKKLSEVFTDNTFIADLKNYNATDFSTGTAA